MNINKRITIFCCFVSMPMFFLSTAHAAIYKCVNVQNEVYYVDKPCGLNHKESEIKPTLDPISSDVSNDLSSADSNDEPEIEQED